MILGAKHVGAILNVLI